MGEHSQTLLFLLCLVLSGVHGDAAQTTSLPTNAPPHIALQDQYDAPQQLTFPAAKVTLLTIADRQGAEEVKDWIAALKPAFAGRVDIRGLADVSAVPRLLRGRVRRGFREHFTYPVMLDWSGTSCEAFGFRHGVANVLVLDRHGRICARAYGQATEASLDRVRAALEAALAQSNSKPQAPNSKPMSQP